MPESEANRVRQKCRKIARLSQAARQDRIIFRHSPQRAAENRLHKGKGSFLFALFLPIVRQQRQPQTAAWEEDHDPLRAYSTHLG